MQDVQIESEADPRADPAGRTFVRALTAVVVLAALWRLGVLVVDKWHQPLLLNDSIYYSAQAQQLADGIWFREIFVDRPGAEHGPLTSILLASVSWVDDPVPWQRLLTVLCGIATVALIGLLGRRVGGERVGLIAASIAAVYPNLWMNDGLVMSESVSVLMVVSVLLAAIGLLDRPTIASAALVGLLAGLAALARSELALLTPAVVVLLAAAMWRATAAGGRAWRVFTVPAVVGVVSLATVAPWVGFNLTRFEEAVTLTTNDGTTLLGSYCDATFSGPELGGWSIFCVTADPAYSMDEEPSVRSVRQRDLAMRYARAHVDELPKVVLARVARTLDLYGLDSLVAQDVGEERWRWASWAGIVSWWALFPLAMTGAVLMWRSGRPGAAGTAVQRRRWWVLVCPVVSVFVITVVFYGAHRIRSSMEPTVVVFAAVALAAAVERRADRPQPGDLVRPAGPV
ncbi:MAG: glycosyltransferase family 39 protein [Acidimicrobiales bacterium]|nr:glycosyltransferase family 39 protein [Acidimicrobiales bacterium]MCB9393971.1 glycosyltransferase family 39 protein [Acidimicrobiaceae bacterium]